MLRFIKNVSTNSFFNQNIQRMFCSVQEAAPVEKFINTDDKMTPREIVKYLDTHIIGQNDAKKSMAIALSTVHKNYFYKV